MLIDKFRHHEDAPGDDELEAALAGEVPEFPLRRADLHTRALYKLVRAKTTRWTPVGAATPQVPHDQRSVPTEDVFPGILAVPLEDEDVTDINFAKKATFVAFEKLPIIDDPRPWSSSDAAAEVVTKLFADILPKASTQWVDVTSDRTVERLALQGLAAHRLQRIDDDPEGAAYAVDLGFMHSFPVREPYLRYGACAYFTSGMKLQRIYTAHDDRTHRPGEEGWEQAKWVWRSSLFTGVTIVDHLGSTHYLTANLLVSVARETLPPDHPLRRLVKVFTYGGVDINRDAAMGLSNQGGIAHRLFACDYPGLARLLLRGIETRKFRTFPDQLADLGVDAIGPPFLYATDGTALFEIFRSFVNDYLILFFEDDQLVADPDIRAFWQHLLDFAPTLGLAPLTHGSQLKDFIAQFMFWVTGGHQQVGGVVDYVVDPEFMGAKLVATTNAADAQSTIQMWNLTVFTGLEQPPLVGDYSHLFAGIARHDDAVAVFARYQAKLIALSDQIERRNATIEQPFNTFNPAILDTSVST